VGFIDFGEVSPGWRDEYPALAKYFDRLDEQKAFAETRPVMFELTEKVV
jgi:glutathione S-transferase